MAGPDVLLALASALSGAAVATVVANFRLEKGVAGAPEWMLVEELQKRRRRAALLADADRTVDAEGREET